MKCFIDDLYGFFINQLLNSEPAEPFLLVAPSERHKDCQ